MVEVHIILLCSSNLMFAFVSQAELAVSEFSGNGAGILSTASTAASTFLLVFVSEWGD